MDYYKILQKFEALEDGDKTWILCTLLEFRAANLTEFMTRYGLYTHDKIAKILKEGE